MIKQGDDYTFQKLATVYNNVPKDFKGLMILKHFQGK